MNRADRRKSKRQAERKVKRHIGHPARKTRAEKRAAFRHPSESQRDEQEANRINRERWHKHPGDGCVSSWLDAAAEYMAPRIIKAHGLDSAETKAVERYFVGILGEVFNDFTRDAYEQWRADALVLTHLAMQFHERGPTRARSVLSFIDVAQDAFCRAA